MSKSKMVHAQGLQRLIKHKTIASLNDTKPFVNLLNEIKTMFPTLVAHSTLKVFEHAFYFYVKGRNSNDPLLFMNHHDVVNVKEGWVHDPFLGEIKDNIIYGRGVIDTKGGLYSMLEAMEELLLEGYIPEHDIYLLSTGDEEENGTGASFISHHFLEKNIHFKSVYDEGGLIVKDPIMGSDNYYAMVAVGEKPVLDVKFTYRSNGGHASHPGRNTPIAVISSFINEVEHSHKFKKKMSKATKLTFISFSKRMHGILKFIFRHPTLFSLLIKEVVGKISDTVNAMFRTTIAFTMINGGNANNVIPNEVSVHADIRVAHHQGIYNVVKILQGYSNKYGLEMEITCPPYNSSTTDVSSKGLGVIKQALKETFPEAEMVPYVSTTASDARFMNIVSNEIYGIVPFKVSDEQLDSIHGDNESLNIDNLPRAINFYKFLMRQ